MTGADTQILWTSLDAAQATGGSALGDWSATGISIDTRTLAPGDLFVAIEGPNFDGHDYIIDAINAGAVAAMASKIPVGVTHKTCLLMVDDVSEALADLGRAARSRSKASIIAVTGSVGKTGTKEMLRCALSSQGVTAATIGNLNNHWGLPLSLARMPDDAKFGIFEIGMNHPGEIVPLSQMARPHVAIVTTVESVHSAHFDSIEQIADAKAEIFAGLEPGGVAIINIDNSQFERLANAARARGAKVVAFGESDKAAVRLTDYSPDGNGSDVTAEVFGETASYCIGVPGHHWAINSLGVLAAVSAVGGDVRESAGCLASMSAPQGRGRKHGVHIPGGEVQVIDESYNASPASVVAAIETLAAIEPATGGRRIAVLGDMLELGTDEFRRHAELAAPLVDCGIDLVFTAGARMDALWDALPRAMRGGHAAKSSELASIVTAAVAPGDVVSIKGSAGSKMDTIVHALFALDRDGAHPRAANGG